MEEVKIELGNEEVDRGGKVFAMASFRIFIVSASEIPGLTTPQVCNPGAEPRFGNPGKLHLGGPPGCIL